jgi:hypothetical protein
VHDFLFTYYPFPPTRLRQWTPALGEFLEWSETAAADFPWLAQLPVCLENGVLALDATKLALATQRAASFIINLCEGMLARPARFACYGLHEWAMVYKQPAEEVRHQGWTLRLAPEALAEFVDSQSLCCTHFDAFRFFTPEARPLNHVQPSLDQRVALEQSGCLHANMDLYKWTTKLWPWAGADLLGETFAFAMQGRDLDMRASPYDLTSLGYSPVAIETPEGRETYRTEQQRLQELAIPLRERLLTAARGVVRER